MISRCLARAARLAVSLVALLAAATAAAGPRICTSADTLVFGNRVVGSSTTQRSTVANCGDAPWSFSGVSVHPATGSDWHVATTCVTGQALDPAASCRIDVTFAPRVTGQTSGALWLHNTTSTPDQLVTFYGRGVDAQAGGAVVDFAPAVADFGTQAVGALAGPLAIAVRNVGAAPLVPTALVINGPAAYDYATVTSGDPGDCAIGVAVAPGASCRMNFFFRPQQPGPRTASLVVDAPQLAGLAVLSLTGRGAVEPPAGSVGVVEFHHAPTRQYFLTADAAEAAFLDSGGLGPDWRRTGLGFTAFARDATTIAIDAPVCRFFGAPGVGPNSHFLTADAAECARVRVDPHWQYEGIAFRAVLPLAGSCPAGYRAITRLWQPGGDPTGSRHRYLGDAAEIERMRTDGWVVEGVVFCALS